MSDRTVGTCSLCGGAVTVPNPWMGTIPPTPRCSGCNAVPASPHGPVIAMRPSAPRATINGYDVFDCFQQWRREQGW